MDSVLSKVGAVVGTVAEAITGHYRTSREQRRCSDVYRGQARDLEVRRERGVADPRQEADDHQRYR